MKKIFLTINPHQKHTSKTTLIDNFNFALKRYYRKMLGQRFYKHKDKQFTIGLFPEYGTQHPHIHSIIEIAEEKIDYFCNFIVEQMKKTYPSLTFDTQIVKDTEEDLIKVIKYCIKEGNEFLTNQDLYEI